MKDGCSRSLGDFLLGIDYGFEYIPSEKEVMHRFTNRIKEGFCGCIRLASDGCSADDAWEAFVGWCIKNLDESGAKQKKFERMRRQRSFYSRSLPVRLAMKVFNPRIYGGFRL